MENSLLGKLSPELRNNIYGYALTSPEPFTVQRHIGTGRLVQYKPTKQQHPLALARTCSAARKECTQLFYANNVFIIRCYKRRLRDPIPLTDFARSIGKVNASALRMVILDVEPLYFTLWHRGCSSLLKDALEALESATETYQDCALKLRAALLHDHQQPHGSHFELDLRDLPSTWNKIFANMGRRWAVLLPGPGKTCLLKVSLQLGGIMERMSEGSFRGAQTVV